MQITYHQGCGRCIEGELHLHRRLQERRVSRFDLAAVVSVLRSKIYRCASGHSSKNVAIDGQVTVQIEVRAQIHGVICQELRPATI